MDERRPLIRVDLGTGQISREAISDDLRRKYLGGEGINSRLLWEHFLHVDPKIDPLQPENVLIAGTGPLAGTCVGTGSKMKFTYKSPAYGIYGDTSVGGNLSSQLRWAGYDHIVVTGKAEHPVYLFIHDDEVQIRDARHIWGTTVPEADAAIKRELGDGEVEMASIGQAGENLVRFASIMVSCHRAGGRGGGGCVMGSKNLKAIAARGTKGIRIHDPKGLLGAADEFLARNAGKPRSEKNMRVGTLQHIRRHHGLGFNTFHNGQGREMPEQMVAQLDHNWYRENIGMRAYACSAGCVFGCSHWHRINGDESPAAKDRAGEWGTKPEYATTNVFGASCGCSDLVAVTRFNVMCNHYGMDVMETGMTISFLMELWERGIIGEGDTSRWNGGEALSLDWGNAQSIGRIIESMATQANELGELLNGGVYRTAERIGEIKGVSVLKYANYGKGGATHEGPARSMPTLSMACAVASIGAHHLKGMGLTPGSSLAYLGRREAGDTMSTALKGAGHAIGENLRAVGNSVGLCTILADSQVEINPLELIGRSLEAATGLTFTADELLKAGERVVNVQKAFNSRLGLRREHDTLCDRWLNEPQLEGMSKGNKAGDFLETAKDEYYSQHGWDVVTSLQTRQKLTELEMFDVAEVLGRENALAVEG